MTWRRRRWRATSRARASSITRLLPLMRALFVETNPIPVKQALAFMGKCTAEMRMPLTQMSPGPAEKLHVADERDAPGLTGRALPHSARR